jgi:hypothetical protein
MLIITGAEAPFPLTSQSDQANITVFGVILDDQDDQTTNVLVGRRQSKRHLFGIRFVGRYRRQIFIMHMMAISIVDISAGRFFISFRIPERNRYQAVKV